MKNFLRVICINKFVAHETCPTHLDLKETRKTHYIVIDIVDMQNQATMYTRYVSLDGYQATMYTRYVSLDG